MNQDKRLTFSLIIGLASELINKIIPILILHFAQKKLGTESFGYAQFGISIGEIIVPFILLGSQTIGPILLGQVKDNPQKINSLMSHVTYLKFFQYLMSCVLLLIICFLLPSYQPYFPLFLLACLSLVFSVIDSIWVLLGIQKMMNANLIISLSRLFGLICIILFIKDHADAVLYCFLTMLPNIMINLGTFLYSFTSMHHFTWTPFNKKEFIYIFKQSSIYGVVSIMSIVFDRIDILLVERMFDQKNLGLYTGAARIQQSIATSLLTLGLVFFSEAITIKNREALTKHINISLWVGCSLAFPIIFGVWFTSKEILSFIFNNEFNQVSQVLSLLVCNALSVIGIDIFGNQVLMIQKKIKPIIYAYLAGMTLALLTAYYLGSVFGLTGIALGMLIGKATTLFGIVSHAKHYMNKLNYKEIFKTLIPAISMAFCLFLAKDETLLLKIIGGGIIYSITWGIVYFSKLRKIIFQLF